MITEPVIPQSAVEFKKKILACKQFADVQDFIKNTLSDPIGNKMQVCRSLSELLWIPFGVLIPV